jgi:hypothetical protein
MKTDRATVYCGLWSCCGYGVALQIIAFVAVLVILVRICEVSSSSVKATSTG